MIFCKKESCFSKSVNCQKVKIILRVISVLGKDLEESKMSFKKYWYFAIKKGIVSRKECMCKKKMSKTKYFEIYLLEQIFLGFFSLLRHSNKEAKHQKEENLWHMFFKTCFPLTLSLSLSLLLPFSLSYCLSLSLSL